MSDQNIPSTNAESNVEPQAVCSTGCKNHNSGILRAVLYTPIVLILGGLAALATFPELANYATPLIGESNSQYTCPIAAALGMAGKSGCSSMRSSCSSSSQSDSMGCCPAMSNATSSCCPSAGASSSASESAAGDDLTNADTPISAPISADDEPADAIAVVNAVDQESPSN